jgi:hypothetical protein
VHGYEFRFLTIPFGSPDKSRLDCLTSYETATTLRGAAERITADAESANPKLHEVKMNRSKELDRIRFMLGKHAEVLDLASSPMEILEFGRALGYSGDSDDAAWDFAYPKLQEAVKAFDHIRATDRRAKAYAGLCSERTSIA